MAPEVATLCTYSYLNVHCSLTCLTVSDPSDHRYAIRHGQTTHESYDTPSSYRT